MKLSAKFKIAIPLAVIFALLVFFAPRTAKWPYVYQKGTPWMYETFRASMDFPILKTEAQIAEEASGLSDITTPYFKLSPEITAREVAAAAALDYGTLAEIEPVVVTSLKGIYDKGVMSDASFASLPSDGVIYLQKDKRAVKVPSSEVYSLTGARATLLATTIEAFPSVKVDSFFRKAGVYDILSPNLTLDEQLTSIVSSREGQTISRTAGMKKAGDIIISQGEIVTEELEQILDSYRAEYESNTGMTHGWKFWTGNLLISLAMVLCLFFAIHYSNPGVFSDYNRYLYILTIFASTAVLAMLIVRFAPRWIMLAPFPVFALYLKSFFKTGVIYPVYIISLLPLLLYASHGAALFLMYVVSGTVTLYAFKYFYKGVKQFVTAMVAFGTSLAVYFALGLLGIGSLSFPREPVLLFAASLLQVAAYPFIYLMERAFNLVSSSRLEELTDSSNGLLLELEQKAPGTFQHSLQVSAMAQSVARAIGADDYLIKAGALYHDIGKMNNPLCFVENESLITSGATRYHDGMTPLQSAQDIIRHVTEGMELASEHRLPSIVSDFIITHHGTGCVSYFYDKFLREGGDPALKGEFCYPGRRPQTREQAVLMICDSVEAASRTLKDYSPDTVSEFVDKMINDRLHDGQLSEASISLKELDTVSRVLKAHIAQTHHERIKYPKRRVK